MRDEVCEEEEATEQEKEAAGWTAKKTKTPHNDVGKNHVHCKEPRQNNDVPKTSIAIDSI